MVRHLIIIITLSVKENKKNKTVTDEEVNVSNFLQTKKLNS